MRVFVAGATGAIGRPLVARLLGEGRAVTGMSRRPEGAAMVEGIGARGVVADALDAAAVARAVSDAAPDVVVHQLTALPEQVTPKSMMEGYLATDRLRTVGTRNLLEAAPGARHVVQSVAFAVRPEGSWVQDEAAPLYTDAAGVIGDVSRRLAAMEASVVDAGGIVLRYGFFYGPGTWYAREGSVGQMLRKRRYPVVAPGDGHWSWLHIDDAVAATALAVAPGGEPGVYNVVDDHPAPAGEWIPALARALGAKPPRKVPAWLARRVAGDAAVFYANHVRGARNDRFRSAFGWEPGVPDWREGFRSL